MTSRVPFDLYICFDHRETESGGEGERERRTSRQGNCCRRSRLKEIAYYKSCISLSFKIIFHLIFTSDGENEFAGRIQR